MPAGAGEEFLLGVSISSPGTSGKCNGYSPDLPGITWDALLTLLARENINEMEIMFLGVVGSDGRCGGTGFGIVTRRDVQRTPNPYWGQPGQPQAITTITRDPDWTPQLVQDLLHLRVQPIHVVGCIVRKLS